MSNFVETWKGIATALGRSERWCRYMARRGADPLPVFKVGGIVRLNNTDLEDWLSRQRDRSSWKDCGGAPRSKAEPSPPPQGVPRRAQWRAARREMEFEWRSLPRVSER